MAQAFQGSFSELNFDPIRAGTSARGNLIRMLYSRLVEYDSEGQIRGVAAQEFRVLGRTVTFIIRDDLKSSKGNPITAEDIAFNFQRVVNLERNHSDGFGMLDCVGPSGSEDVYGCAGIRVKGNQIEFTLKPDIEPGIFISMLVGTSYSIVPRPVLLRMGSHGGVANYDETSGYYFLSKDDRKEFRHELSLNAHFPIKVKGMPRKIVFNPIYGDEAVESMLEGRTDFIPTVSSLSKRKARELSDKLGDGVQIHATMPMQLRAVMFTPRGIAELDEDQRRSFGAKIRKQYLLAFGEEELEPSDQIFPGFLGGELSAEQLDILKSLYEKAESGEMSAKNLEFAVTPKDFKRYHEIISEDSSLTGKVKIREFVKAPWTVPFPEQPHAYVANQDSMYYEDISILSYGLSHGFLHTQNADEWMKEYIRTSDAGVRLDRLRDLQFRSLKGAYIVPIGFGPYLAAILRPWEMNFSGRFAASPIWQVHHR